MSVVVVIVGTPGTGKTTIAKLLAERIHNSVVVHINHVIMEKHIYTAKASDGALVVDMRRLGEEVKRIIKDNRGMNLILEGHVLCDMRVEGAAAVVLREHLSVLAERMARRGYSVSKMRDNIVSEAIDYSGINALMNYERVIEVFPRKSSVPSILKFIHGGGNRNRAIELLGELEPILRTNRKLAI